MKPFARNNAGRQRTGGFAALYLAVAYLIAMPYFLAVVNYPSVVDPVKKVALLADHQASMQVMYLITYVIFGIVLAVLSLTLYRRMRDGAPVMMQAANAIGLIWACALVASGMIFNSGMVAVVALYHTDPSQAVLAWQAIEPVAQGLGGGNGEILGGLWILLVSCAAFRTQGLPKLLNWLGLGIGAAGVLSVVPVLKDAAYVFGLLQIVWLLWLGIVMMRSQSEQTVTDAKLAGTKEVAHSTC
jgi:hypothetical protein